MTEPSDDRIWFEIPTTSGKAQVRVPFDLSAEEAAHIGRVIAAVLVAMYPDALSAAATAFMMGAGQLGIEAQANRDRGPASGICGQFAGGTRHCMRDYGHVGDHEWADLPKVTA